MATSHQAEARPDSFPQETRPTPHKLLDVLSAAGLLLTSGAALVSLAVAAHGSPVLGRGLQLKLVLIACLPVLFARRWPVHVMFVGAVGSAIQMATASRVIGISLVLGVATYYVASRRQRRESVPITLSVAVGLSFALLSASLRLQLVPVGQDVIEGLMPLVAAWVIGDAVAARRRYQAGLAEQQRRERQAEVERARLQVREERVRIARELHDVVAHTLAVITVQSGVGRRLMDRRPEAAASALESIETIGRTAQEELRVVLSLLRDEQSTGPALAPAPRILDLKDVIDNIRPSGTEVDLRLAVDQQVLSPAMELTVYRIVQEALTNVVRHAPGAHAVVSVLADRAQVRVEVTDDGRADGAAPASPGTGHGIAGMRERVVAFGGTLVAGPLPSGGFRVLARLPIEGSAA